MRVIKTVDIQHEVSSKKQSALLCSDQQGNKIIWFPYSLGSPEEKYILRTIPRSTTPRLSLSGSNNNNNNSSSSNNGNNISVTEENFNSDLQIFLNSIFNGRAVIWKKDDKGNNFAELSVEQNENLNLMPMSLFSLLPDENGIETTTSGNSMQWVGKRVVINTELVKEAPFYKGRTGLVTYQNLGEVKVTLDPILNVQCKLFCENIFNEETLQIAGSSTKISELGIQLLKIFLVSQIFINKLVHTYISRNNFLGDIWLIFIDAINVSYQNQTIQKSIQKLNNIYLFIQKLDLKSRLGIRKEALLRGLYFLLLYVYYKMIQNSNKTKTTMNK